MGRSLSELVNAALQQADENIKIASAGDAHVAGVETDDLFADLLPVTKVANEDCPSGEGKPSAKKKDDKKDEKEKTSAAENAAYCYQLAEALELSANVFMKVANSPLDAPGPSINPAAFQGQATQHPKAHTSSVPAANKSHGGGGSEKTMGAPNGIETNKKDFSSIESTAGAAENHPSKTAGWTKSKTASERLINAKIAQAEMLSRLGQTEAAEQLLAAIEQQVTKEAQDPSSPQPTLPGHSSDFMLSTEPGPSTMVPENAGLINMTRAQARDRSTREATQFISEAPKKDNAVAAHTLTTEGQKTSSLLEAVHANKKSAAIDLDEPPGMFERRATLRREGRENKLRSAVISALPIGALGGLVGYELGGPLGASIGGTLGAVGGASYGAHKADAERASRKRLEHEAVGRYLEKNKTSGLAYP